MNIFNKAFNACKKGVQKGLVCAGYVADKVRTGAQTMVGKVKCKVGLHKIFVSWDMANPPHYVTNCMRCGKRLNYGTTSLK